MWLGLIAGAAAGDLFINDTKVDPVSVNGVQLEKVDVTFDAGGNVRITAPGYRIKVVERLASEREVKPATRAAPGVPLATWWLVTQDLNSSGHSVDVFINDDKVMTVRSGGEPVIYDLAEHLKVGLNSITIKSQSVDPAGGAFYVVIGHGEDDAGTVRVNHPEVDFGLGTANKRPVERRYNIEVRSTVSR